jgi:hypothetical protein
MFDQEFLNDAGTPAQCATDLEFFQNAKAGGLLNKGWVRINRFAFRRDAILVACIGNTWYLIAGTAQVRLEYRVQIWLYCAQADRLAIELTPFIGR